MHLWCTGAGSPTVILEAGAGSSSIAWWKVQPDVSRFTRVCSYDRAGLGWSEKKPGPRSSLRIAGELHALLAAAQEAPPYVMVGHSLGGPRTMIFAKRFRGEVAGFVWVDAVHPDQSARFSPALDSVLRAEHTRPIPWLTLLSETGVVRLLIRQERSRLLPDSVDEGMRALGPQSLPEALREFNELDETLEEARAIGSFGHVPIVVLTADTLLGAGGMQWQLAREFNEKRFDLDEDMATWSDNSDHRVVEGSGHFIQVQRPDAVVAAVQDVVTAVREGTAVPHAKSVSGGAEGR
jgi:pimeloyl-ACP methyl ester carboxylesterase